MTHEKRQALLDECAVGTVLQAGMWGRLMSRGLFVREDLDAPDRPCRCYLGHTRDRIFGEPRFPAPFLLALMHAYDDALDLEDWRHRCAQVLFDAGYDDSAVWMEGAL